MPMGEQGIPDIRKILVTGATGFVGSALCERLLADGNVVRAAVRTGDSVAYLPSGVDAVPVGSIGADTDWSKALTPDIDSVVHLAARVHVMADNAVDPLAEFRKVNVEGTERLARMAAKAGVRRLIYLSTIKVNGEGKPEPYREEDGPAPAEPYATSKWEAEVALKRVAAETGLEVAIIRPPLVYGPGVKANFHSLLEMVYRRVPLPLAGIHNKRSLICVGNLVDAISVCLTRTEAIGQTYLVSDGDDISTPELIRRTAFAMGKKQCLLPIPSNLLRRVGKVAGKGPAVERLLGTLAVDAGKIRRELGWIPPFTMEEGLAETSAWFLDRITDGRSKTRKRLFDLFMVLLALTVMLVPMLVIAALIKLTSKGPALYWSDRVGRNNIIFRMPKFRTMRVDTPTLATHLLREPARFLTPIGKFLRKSSLDELPQLYSILRGEMSFVGPRPALYNQHDLIGLRTSKGVHLISPGLTGWAQINGRDDLPIPRKVEFDEYYMKNKSFNLDVRIIFLTFLKVTKSEGVTH